MRPGLDWVQRMLEDEFGPSAGKIKSSSPVSGGCIHTALRVEMEAGVAFVKLNKAAERPNFEAEAHGLGLLGKAGALPVPKPIAVDDDGQHACLLMQWIEPGAKGPRFWEDFGQGLANLHRHTANAFGLGRDNYIGRLPQANERRENWPQFFAEMRLLPQLELAARKGLADARLRQGIEGLLPRLSELMPKEAPALLHGDLWSGNFLCGPNGRAHIVDPAVYYGHREAEIAFTRLFGGFAPDFYSAYHEAFALENGWEERIALFNIYPLMVHLNLFGASYLPEILESLSRYG